MKAVDVNEAKTIMLEILQDFHDYCTDNGLRYVLSSGTLLGAIRHNGYIPWDDDIDVYMPRPDYEKLLRKYNNDANVDNVLFEYTINDSYKYAFAKLCKKGTLCIEKGGYCGVEIGIYIDIFPLDGLGTSIKSARRQVRKIKKYNCLLLSLLVNQWRDNVSFIKNFAIWILHAIARLYGGHQKILKKMHKIFKQYDYDDSEYVGQIAETPGYNKIMPKRVFEDRVYHIFENKQFLVPREFDHVLKSLYGDYMRLPPEEKRQYTHGFEAYRTDDLKSN